MSTPTWAGWTPHPEADTDTAKISQLFLQLLTIDVPQDMARLLATHLEARLRVRVATTYAAEMYEPVWIIEASMAIAGPISDWPDTTGRVKSLYAIMHNASLEANTRRVVWSKQWGVTDGTFIHTRGTVKRFNERTQNPLAGDPLPFGVRHEQ
jgi:hypothetical protein